MSRLIKLALPRFGLEVLGSSSLFLRFLYGKDGFGLIQNRGGLIRGRVSSFSSGFLTTGKRTSPAETR